MEYEEYDRTQKQISEKYRKRSKRTTILSLAALASMAIGLGGEKFYNDEQDKLKAVYPIAVKKIVVEETLEKLEQAREHLENIVGSSYNSDSSQRIKGLQEDVGEEIILARKDLESITAEPQFKRYEDLREKISNRQNLYLGVIGLGGVISSILLLIDSINERKERKELSNLKSKYELKEFMRASLDVSGYN